MSDACTIYSKTIDIHIVYEKIKNISLVPMEVEGTEKRWKSISVVQQSTIKFSHIQQKVGTYNDFSQLILGTYSFFRNVQTDAGERKDNLLRAISECKFAIGVMGLPAFNEAERHYDMIFEITKALNGFIFNGSGMVDENGLMILDSNGNFDVE